MSTIKYQVFISSTYEDLEQERDEVIKAILEMGHIPVGMEMFSAADEEQWKLIARQIDQSDYYIVIVAHRYGSVTGKKSYTEKEHDYAVGKGVPIIAFIIEDSAPWPKDRIELDIKKIESLKNFKQKLKCKLVGFWSTRDELGGKVSRSLIKLMAANPRPGWIRTTETVGPEVVGEMSRLSSENARLINENQQLRKDLEESTKVENSHFSQGEELIDIEFFYPITKNGKHEEQRKVELTWNEIFMEIGLELLIDNLENNVELTINKIVKNKKDLVIPSIDLEKDYDFYPCVKKIEILKIKMQFIALGYIDVEVITLAQSDKSIFSFNNNHIHWILTSLGKRKLSELLAIRRESSI